MQAIRIRKRIDSETITLPELRSLVGQVVEIVVHAENQPSVTPGTGDGSALMAAAAELEGYDFDAWRRQREIDREYAKESLP